MVITPCPSKWILRLKETTTLIVMVVVQNGGSCRTVSKAHSSAINDHQQGSLTLFDLLRTGIAYQQATDPHDYVYAILRLVNNQGSTNVIPDYSLTVQQVFAQTAAKVNT